MADETIVNGVASEAVDQTVAEITRKEDHVDGHRVLCVQARVKDGEVEAEDVREGSRDIGSPRRYSATRSSQETSGTISPMKTQYEGRIACLHGAASAGEIVAMAVVGYFRYGSRG
ncbi:hypothetical protein F0562_028315 [Nyssa sinensis]|uniref:Uncharacterized protein n=1 Tax=Nyssa sinensis TaxID=561372 RepID=A0A5J5B7Y8_9ASTE|nr:hypothetical protein F0562_028315 [Nyssa sinensis]